ncbi:MAG: sodium:proton antiporter [Pseudomonadota bacterium]
MDEVLFAAALIGALGVGAQWFAWRLNLPGIVLMAAAGLIAGPGLGVLRPEEAFGDVYRPMISLAVAIILFEGGLSLNFSEIKGVSRGIFRLVLPGVPLACAFGAVAGVYAAGLSVQSALLFAGVLIVTGPTVIIPLLRQARLDGRPSALLKWEGIINDPIGALLAVILFEVIAIAGAHGSMGGLIASLVLGSGVLCVFGWVFGSAVAAFFRRGWAPEHLKAPILFVLVILAFIVGNGVQEEGGLIAVTVMGVRLGNARLASITDLRRFKETVTILLVSGVFVMLTANLDRATLALLDWRAAAFVAAMLFIVRPAAVLIATMWSGVSWAERGFLAWIAPRGIVAVAISELFASKMVEAGYEDAVLIPPLAFAMVFATVVLHGFSIAPLARALGLAYAGRPGVLIVGASPFAASLAKKLKEMGETVLIADSSWRRLRAARLADIPTYYGEILSEATEHHLEFNRYGTLLALGGNEAHNALVAGDLAPEIGRAQVYQFTSRPGDDEDRRAFSRTLQGQPFIRAGIGFEDMMRRHYAGWVFQRTRLTDAYGPKDLRADLPEDALIVGFVKKSGELVFQSDAAPIEPAVGDTALVYLDQAAADERRKAREEAERAEKEADDAEKPAEEDA